MSQPLAERILGIDPGSRATGFAVIESAGNRTNVLEYGVIRTPAKEGLPARIRRLHDALAEVIERHRPGEAAIEEVFTAHNVRSALVLGQARGALLLAASRRCEVHEYSARAVKKAVVGYGQADKQQVATMVRALLTLRETPPLDAADALAIALCHLHHRQSARRLRAAR